MLNLTAKDAVIANVLGYITHLETELKTSQDEVLLLRNLLDEIARELKDEQVINEELSRQLAVKKDMGDIIRAKQKLEAASFLLADINSCLNTTSRS